jgi:rubrerythrin
MPFKPLTPEEQEKWEREMRQMECMSPEHRPSPADVQALPNYGKRIWVCPSCGYEAEYKGKCPFTGPAVRIGDRDFNSLRLTDK